MHRGTITRRLAAGVMALLFVAAPAALADEGEEGPACTGTVAEVVHEQHEEYEDSQPELSELFHEHECTLAPLDPTSDEFVGNG